MMRKLSVLLLSLSFFIGFKYYQYNSNIANIRKDVQSYMNYMQYSIKKKWQPPTEINNKMVVVEYTILKSGEITNVNIVQSSNDLSLDNSTINAINKIKLPPLPDEIGSDYVTTTFTFKKN